MCAYCRGDGWWLDKLRHEDDAKPLEYNVIPEGFNGRLVLANLPAFEQAAHNLRAVMEIKA